MPNDITLERVVKALEAKQEGKEWRAACPIHGGHSLLISRGNKAKVVAKCFGGCADKSVWGAIVQRVGVPDGKVLEPTGFSLADYAALKRLPLHGLRWLWSVSETTYRGKPAIRLPYFDHSGRLMGTKVRWSASSHNTFWEPGENGAVTTVPYGLDRPNINDVSDLVICEGESDVHTLAVYDIAALGISGANGWKVEFRELAPIHNAERIFIIKEPGAAGEKFARNVGKDLPPEKVFIVSLPVKDPSELHLKHFTGKKAGFEAFEKEFDTAISNAQALADFDSALARTAAVNQGGYMVQSAADIVMKPIEWLWPNHIPKGKITVFAGNPGTGKSIVACWLASVATTGASFPDALNANEPSDVLMMFCEDDAADTVVPRLKAAGADLQRIKIIKKIVATDATIEERQLAFDTDRALLEKALAENPEIKLVIVDPITSFLGETKSIEKDLRDVLVPLADLAARTGVTFVLVAHFNKRSDVTALHKIMGPVAMSGVARAAWLFAEDTESEDEDAYLMLRGKLNIARKTEGRTYYIQERETPVGMHPYIQWGDTTEVTADQAFGSLGAFGDKNGKRVAAAGEWLKTHLGDSAKPAKEIMEAGKLAGHSERTLNRAKKELGIRSTPVLKQWFWQLPGDTTDAP